MDGTNKGSFFMMSPLKLMQKNISKWKVCICTSNFSFLFPDNVSRGKKYNALPLNNQFSLYV